MRVSEILAAVRSEGGQWRVDVPDNWAQGRSLFGGLQVAIAAKAMRSLVPADLPLRSVQVTFVAPVPAGTVSVSAQILRTGKSVTQVEARILDAGATACLVTAVFGAARPSVVAVELPAPAALAPVESLRDAPFMQGVMPTFLQHVQMRWARGAAPFSGKGDPRAQIYMRLRDETMTDEGALIAIADIIPPLGLSYLKKMAPGSSMTWMLDFLHHDFQQGDAWWRVDAELSTARDGYSNQSLTLYDAAGRAVAMGRQSMVIFG